ncbi:DHHA1 domain-containing protein [Methanoculleus sp.]|jgi:single-stranded DNA-specific DHH superfamily exonuclease|uniref:DHHA1 domain-containing protein n=1 Tax=Methanoculleus sp. TaxID=90427 RepID=UPI002617EBD5|nr:DHHA1 domain-containing protein [Methanoculleus sp.]MDI6867119.1 DHHA1 domain-containing protein [Methanoculleus sp.]
MSLDTAAATLASHLLEQEFVEVLAHHDADGIAAASILCHAMFRAGGRFRLRIRHHITAADIPRDCSVLLCDFGSALPDLPDDVMVVDHHQPRFEGELHVNPHLAGIDGDLNLSAAGAAYLVAQKMGDNRDLAGLALLGVLGDDQALKGPNREIANEGIANGFITPGRGLLLAGRGLVEQIALSIDPYLPGLSGEPDAARTLVAAVTDEDEVDMEMLLSRIVLKAAREASVTALCSLWGITYSLGREVIDDAGDLTAVVDACGKAGKGDIGASLCLRSSHALQEAREITARYRQSVIAGVRGARRLDERAALYEVDDESVASDVADVLARDLDQDGPVFVIGMGGDHCSISARCPPGVDLDLDALMRTVARASGGHGGGHRHRAGARISAAEVDRFRHDLLEAILA